MTYAIVQDALTIAATAVLYTAIAYATAGILHQIWKPRSPQPVPRLPKVEQPAEPETIPATLHELEDLWSAPIPPIPQPIKVQPSIFKIVPLLLALPPAKIAPVAQTETAPKRKRGRPRKNAA